MKEATPLIIELLKRAGSSNQEVAFAGQKQLAKALTLPLRQGVLKGDIIAGIFEAVKFQPGAAVEFPLDFLAPGSEKDYIAYTIPAQGRIPERHVEGDFVMVPTYEVASSIDFALKYLRDARWDVMARAMQVLEATFVRKMNQDGFRTLMAAATGRAIVVYDSGAPTGLFTKRLIGLMTTAMRRFAGGNSTSTNRGKLTDVYLSPEMLEDIRSWDLSQVDDFTRRQIFLEAGGDLGEASLTRIFGTNLHDIDEFGVGQEFQNYFSTTLGGAMPAGKQEILMGLDLSKDDAFVMPVRQEIELFEDTTFHRQRRYGAYGWGEYGVACLDNRRVLLGAA